VFGRRCGTSNNFEAGVEIGLLKGIFVEALHAYSNEAAQFTLANRTAHRA